MHLIRIWQLRQRRRSQFSATFHLEQVQLSHDARTRHLSDQRIRQRGAHPLLQSGVLAYRRLENGEVSILAVKKHNSKNWGIPKGKIKPHLSFARNAAKEAFEEAGVKGHIRSSAPGTYRAVKRSNNQEIIIEVWVYLLEVTKTAKKWPEKAKRELRWLSPGPAATLLREPLLVGLCAELASASKR